MKPCNLDLSRMTSRTNSMGDACTAVPAGRGLAQTATGGTQSKTALLFTRGVSVHLGKLAHDAGSERPAKVAAFDVEVGLEGALGGVG